MRQSPQATNLKQYVLDGGSVYASDWAHSIVEATWPYAIDFRGDDTVFDPMTEIPTHSHPFVGAATTITGNVLDETMRGAIGSSTANLVYDLDSWVMPYEVGPSSSAMVSGDASYWNNIGAYSTQSDTPLAIQFAEGGSVIYTTFHNEGQLTHDMEAALKEIILSL